jgi:hypothetical protein
MSGSFTAAMEQDLRMRMRSILMSGAAQALDFYVDFIHVDGSGLSYVALLLSVPPDGDRGVFIQIGDPGPDAAAAYDPPTRTFTFPSADFGRLTWPPRSQSFERMAIVHECIHAWRHAMGQHMWTASGIIGSFGSSNEAAAYLGGALFFLNDQGPISASDTTPPWALPPNAIYSHALGLALQVRQSLTPKGCNLNDISPTGLEELKKQIRLSYGRRLPPVNVYQNELHI